MAARRRGATGLSGLLLVDKPAGMTSHDVVSIVRRATGEGRVGHAGTLDPGATGLLVVLVGPAARLTPFLSAADKVYDAEITFGIATDTDDADGSVIAEAPVDPRTGSADHARTVLDGLLGPSIQMPPAFSAIKVDGKVAHRAARSGEPLTLEGRPITVFSAELLGIAEAPVRWRVRFRVSKGTYVRALARDVGLACGSVAHLSALRRVASGALTVDEAHSLDEIADAGQRAAIPELWSDPVRALGLPECPVDPALVADGKPLDVSRCPTTGPDEAIAVTSASAPLLLAVYRKRSHDLTAEAVFPDGVARGGGADGR